MLQVQFAFVFEKILEVEVVNQTPKQRILSNKIQGEIIEVLLRPHQNNTIISELEILEEKKKKK